MPALRFALLLAALVTPPPLAADELSDSLVLVAKPALRDPVYGRSVLVVSSSGKDQHFGFIINRPTRSTLGDLFPQHAPSRSIAGPVFFGGPFDVHAVLALVARDESPGPGSIRMMPGLHVAVDGRTVDRIIAAKPDDVRFVVGLVAWAPGELRHELALGAWYVLDADPGFVLREPLGLWRELVARAQRDASMLTTRAPIPAPALR